MHRPPSQNQEIHGIATEKAPAAIGPYRQAVVHDGLVWASGQIGLDPATGELVEGGASHEARRALDNLAAVLEAAGTCFARCLKLTVYLADMADYGAVNEVYAERFSQENAPARAAVEVAGLPKGARVEIDAVAAL